MVFIVLSKHALLQLEYIGVMGRDNYDKKSIDNYPIGNHTRNKF